MLWERLLSTPIDNLINGKIISDAIGGCYIVIPHEQNSIKAFWFDSNGNQPWGGNGVIVVSNVNRFDFIQDAVVHQEGGFICLWSDFRSGFRDLFATYVNRSGQTQWGEMGLPISAAQTGKYGGKLLQSSDTDFICLFGDFRNNAQLLYAQKIDKNGIIRWSDEGNLMSSRTLSGIPISDGAGGMIAVWGEPGPIRAVYLQKIDKSGNLGVVVSMNDQKERNVPVNFHLYQNHPNPFLNETTIQYSLAFGPLLVSLKIYNLFGEEVVTLVNQIQAPGHHKVRWSGVNQNGLQVAAGIYFYKLAKPRHAETSNRVIENTNASQELVAGTDYPNPFNPATMIRFILSERQKVRLVIFDITGQLVRTLAEGELPAGEQTISWDGRDKQGRMMASGVYFYELAMNNKIERRKMTLVR